MSENTNTTGVPGNEFPLMEGLDLYIGVKIVSAREMNRAEYTAFRGWLLPANENGLDDGFIVQYEDGYISWSPEEQFNKANRRSDSMCFGHAVEAMKKGYKVARSGWNGKAMFLFLVSGSTFKVNRAPLLGIYPEGTEINYCPHIDMKTADGSIVPWLASQTDVLADDWRIVD